MLLDHLGDRLHPDQPGRARDAVEEDRGPGNEVVEADLGRAGAAVAGGGVGAGGELDVAAHLFLPLVGVDPFSILP